MSAIFVFGALRSSPAGDVDFDRSIAPILARNCFECHGPDENKREAGLRFDSRDGAMGLLESGKTAIVPGDLARSELIARITSSDDDDRMPPPDSNRQLTPGEIDLLRRWILQGADWRTHWSFNRLQKVAVPAVSQADWTNGPIDRFVLARLEAAGIPHAPVADRFTLIRRLYFDLIGLPPTPEQVRRFVEDRSPAAYERLVDHLLASPHYGERWGRHWLDVARYGDSNGGDENHAYPHAYHYRDWVIGALNRDMPYDRFVSLQVAGDLLPVDPELDGDPLAATGFLAIGMKIIAEKDPVKKRIDMIDDQINTLGKALLGVSIACARCHDHKFDPISTKDYYALAGIFHSTNISDRQSQSAESAEAKQAREREIAKLQGEIDRHKGESDKLLETGGAIVREAETLDRGNVVIDNSNYGKQIGIISDPGAQKNFAEYDVDIPAAGSFVIQLRYAAAKSRPGRLIVNGKTVNDRAMARTTGSWFPPTQAWFIEGSCQMKEGRNTLRLESEPMMSHIDKIGSYRIPTRWN